MDSRLARSAAIFSSCSVVGIRQKAVQWVIDEIEQKENEESSQKRGCATCVAEISLCFQQPPIGIRVSL